MTLLNTVKKYGKSIRARLLIATSLILFVFAIFLIYLNIKKNTYKDTKSPQANSEKVENYIPTLEVTDSEKDEKVNIVKRLMHGKSDTIKNLEALLKPIHCESFTYQSISDVHSFAKLRIENQNISLGLETIAKGLGDDAETYEFCNNGGDFYLVFSDFEKYPFKTNILSKLTPNVYAGTGKRPYSIAWIREDGSVIVVNNYEEAITENFKELSFYFTCTDVFGSGEKSSVYIACFGAEGPEDTYGLILVDFEKNHFQYVAYCINPLENIKTEDGIPQNNNVYQCYEKDKKPYYDGPIDMGYRFGNE